jgi:hypothetical protein
MEDEYRVKILLSDNIKRMSFGGRADPELVDKCQSLIKRLIQIYKDHWELLYIKKYLRQVALSPDTEFDSLIKVEFLFDYFITQIKRNSVMESIFCASEKDVSEMESLDMTQDVFPHSDTPPETPQKTTKPSSLLRLNSKRKMEEPTRHKKVSKKSAKR